jgi:hypothetical protein
MPPFRRGAILVEVTLTLSFSKKSLLQGVRFHNLDQKANVFDSAEASQG